MNRRNLIKALAVTAATAPLAVVDAARAEDLDQPVTFQSHARDDHPVEPMSAWLAANGLDANDIREVTVSGDRTIYAAAFKRDAQGRLYWEPGTDNAAMEYIERRLLAPVPPELASWYRHRQVRGVL